MTNKSNPKINSIESCAILNNGVAMPVLGLGTWNLKGQELLKTINESIEIGYRHFDTATYYRNEEDLGKALKLTEIPREQIFVTTKVWPSDFGYQETIKAFETNLKKLDLDYVDQYLIHWPSDTTRTHATWKALLKLYEQGKCRSIGVSNFSIQELEALKELGDVVPATNQVQFNPFSFKGKLLDYCNKEGIKLVAYSPLNEGRRLNDKTIISIAKKYNKTVAQVLLRWNLEHGLITIPKTAKKERLLENSQIFDWELSKEDVNALNTLK